jgi:hypothetical protein
MDFSPARATFFRSFSASATRDSLPPASSPDKATSMDSNSELEALSVLYL